MEKIIHIWREIGDWINRICRILIGIQFSIVCIIVIVQVSLRFFTDFSFHWVEECASYFFVWTTMTGSVIASRALMHVSVNTVVKMLPKNLRTGTELFAYALLLLTLMIIIVTGFIQATAQIDQSAMTLPVSMFWVYVSIPLAGLGMTYFALGQILELLVYGKITIPKYN